MTLTQPEKPRVSRGTSNSNARGSTETRRRRKHWLLETYRANVDAETLVSPVAVPLGTGEMACRCYRCGALLTYVMLTVDRIVPGCVKTAKYPRGGTYVRENIRPACSDCNTETGAPMARSKAYAAKKKPPRLRKKPPA